MSVEAMTCGERAKGSKLVSTRGHCSEAASHGGEVSRASALGLELASFQTAFVAALPSPPMCREESFGQGHSHVQAACAVAVDPPCGLWEVL